MSNEQAKQLKAARVLVEDPRNWTKGMYFGKHDEAGVCVVSPADAAECYCMQGAVLKVAGLAKGVDGLGYAGVLTKQFRELDGLLAASVRGRMRGLATWNFNDHEQTTHEEVLQTFDRAITLAESGIIDPPPPLPTPQL